MTGTALNRGNAIFVRESYIGIWRGADPERESMRLKLITGAIGTLILLALAWAQRGPVSVEEFRKLLANRPPAVQQLADAVEKQKFQLMKEGKYTCCLRHPCDFCAMHFGRCPCGANASTGNPVCNECKGGWHAGDGAIPNVKPEEVKTLPRPIGGN